MKVVISQPMFFPWVGMFEQIRLSDIYVHYTDVQFSKGSFTNRVQIKTAQGTTWLTVPLTGPRLGQAINEVRINEASDWRGKHLGLLGQAYADAPYCEDMLGLVRQTYYSRFETIDELSICSMNAVLDYFGMADGTRFFSSPLLQVSGRSSQRVLDIVRAVGGDLYITGHGAKNYLDHELFEQHGIRVEYMAYRKTPYPQLHGEFTPYVSILDLIANTGKNGIDRIHSGTAYWKDCI